MERRKELTGAFSNMAFYLLEKNLYGIFCRLKRVKPAEFDLDFNGTMKESGNGEDYFVFVAGYKSRHSNRWL